MTDEKDFAKGLFVKESNVDFVKLKISINRKQFIEWLKSATSEEHDTWINIDIKESKNGEKWYAEKNNWKPKEKTQGGYNNNTEEDIPF